MTQYTYTPATGQDWLAVAASGRLLVARIGDDEELLTRIAALKLEQLSVHETLDVLTERGLSRTADFALCFWVAGSLQSDGAGVIVYGDTAVNVTTGESSQLVRPTGVSGWGEELVEDATRITFAPHGDEEAVLPLQSGAAWVSRIEVVEDTVDSENASTGSADVASAVETEEETNEAVTETQAEVAAEVGSPPEAESAVPSSSAEPPLPSYAQPPTAPTTMYGESPSAPPAPPLPNDIDLEATVIPESTMIPQQRSQAAEPSLPDESTVVRTPGASAPSTPPSVGAGDHDGMTLLAKEVRAARDAAHVAEHSAAVSKLPNYAFVLELPGGSRQPLDAPVVLGRAPSVSNVPASVLPHLVTLAGDDISRNHVRLAVEGDAVVVTDLHSSNGTQVVVPGRAPQQLRGGEQVPVISGTVVDLGSGVTLRVLEA